MCLQPTGDTGDTGDSRRIAGFSVTSMRRPTTGDTGDAPARRNAVASRSASTSPAVGSRHFLRPVVAPDPGAVDALLAPLPAVRPEDAGDPVGSRAGRAGRAPWPTALSSASATVTGAGLRRRPGHHRRPPRGRRCAGRPAPRAPCASVALSSHQLLAGPEGGHGLGPELVAVAPQPVDVDRADLDRPEAPAAGLVAEVGVGVGGADEHALPREVLGAACRSSAGSGRPPAT